MNGRFEQFKMRAEAVGAEVLTAANSSEALQAVTRLLHQEGVSDALDCYAVWAAGSDVTTVEQQNLATHVPGLKFEVTRDHAARAKVGISHMQWALANTGTVVQAAEEVEKRLVSTLPRTHIALLLTSHILPDLTALLEAVEPSRIGYLAFITGPSRTADIERVLTIGVHGPKRLIVVAVDEVEQ